MMSKDTTKVKPEEKSLKDKLQDIFDDNSNYFSSYTGTPMFMSERAMPKILKVIEREIKHRIALLKKTKVKYDKGIK